MSNIKILHIKRIFTFFEVNTKYISSSVLKTSDFSRVLIMSENYDVFDSRDEIFWYLPKNSKFSFSFILFIGYMEFLITAKGGAENAKTKN